MKHLPSLLHSTTPPLNENYEDGVPTNISLATQWRSKLFFVLFP